jgi:hypothetical protein
MPDVDPSTIIHSPLCKPFRSTASVGPGRCERKTSLRHLYRVAIGGGAEAKTGRVRAHTRHAPENGLQIARRVRCVCRSLHGAMSRPAGPPAPTHQGDFDGPADRQSQEPSSFSRGIPGSKERSAQRRRRSTNCCTMTTVEWNCVIVAVAAFIRPRFSPDWGPPWCPSELGRLGYTCLPSAVPECSMRLRPRPPVLGKSFDCSPSFWERLRLRPAPSPRLSPRTLNGLPPSDRRRWNTEQSSRRTGACKTRRGVSRPRPGMQPRRRLPRMDSPASIQQEGRPRAAKRSIELH